MVKTVLGMGTAAMDTVFGVKNLPKDDAFELLKSESLVPGGSCSNMLVTLAGLGGNAKQIAKIGDDMFGVAIKESLDKDGVNTDAMIIKKGGVSLHTYIVAAENGKHCIFSNPGDCLMYLTPEEITEDMLDDVDIFYSDLFPCKATIKMAALAKKKNIPVIICMQCAPSFMATMGVPEEDIRKALESADLIISGRDGYYELTEEKEDYIKAVNAIYNMYKPALGCVCTAGSDGSVWIDAQGTVLAKAYEVKALDSTGAGDAFLGALIYSFFQKGEDKQKAIDFACAVGAMKCLVWGPRLKVSDAEVQSFMGTTERNS